ncbi:hypothetical protein D3C87_1325300 [compost metagenome]
MVDELLITTVTQRLSSVSVLQVIHCVPELTPRTEGFNLSWTEPLGNHLGVVKSQATFVSFTDDSVNRSLTTWAQALHNLSEVVTDLNQLLLKVSCTVNCDRSTLRYLRAEHRSSVKDVAVQRTNTQTLKRRTIIVSEDAVEDVVVNIELSPLGHVSRRELILVIHLNQVIRLTFNSYFGANVGLSNSLPRHALYGRLTTNLNTCLLTFLWA